MYLAKRNGGNGSPTCLIGPALETARTEHAQIREKQADHSQAIADMFTIIRPMVVTLTELGHSSERQERILTEIRDATRDLVNATNGRK